MSTKRHGDYVFGCNVEAALEVIGGKWKGVILFHLLDGTKRFNELRRMVPNVTQRMLTLQLRELENDGVVHREIYQQIPPRVEYSLTEFGRSLEPILLLMRDWGQQYIDQILSVRPNHRRPVSKPVRAELRR
ncbi:MAG: helix-turn-helix transcriptional regulator [Anaerolineae bacterium]|nr:helix-turn-helix transcriptional regulator [Anaerolineae bacterium]